MYGRVLVSVMAVCTCSWLFAADDTGGKSALERDPGGWVDLLPGKDLKGWKRVLLPPDKELSAKNPWSVDEKNRLLICDGVGIKEMLLTERQYGDGIFHVEWRFRPVKDKTDYNSGIYVRSKADGKEWVQAQVANVEKPPFMGDLFADAIVDGEAKRSIIQGTGKQRVRPPGEWNTYEVICKGKNIDVWINGATATTWKDCPIPRGHIGMQAEYFYIEFRNLKFKEL